MVEKMLRWYGEIHGLPWAALRYFNAAGADPDGELGEVHDPETHLIPRVIQAALGELPEVGIFGTDYPTPDGTAVRDYIHVTDLADAHVPRDRRLGGERWSAAAQPGHRSRPLGSRGGRHGREGIGTVRPGAGGAEASRGSARVGCGAGTGRRGAGLEAGSLRPRNDHHHCLALA